MPISSIVNAYLAARDLNYPTVLLGGEFLKKGRGKFTPQVFIDAIHEATGEIPLLSRLSSPYVLENHGLSIGSAMPYGRGAQYISEEDTILKDEEEIPSLCKDVLKVISTHPNGNVTACCGIMTRDESLLNIGNWREQSLAEIVETAQEDLILNWIRYLGLRDMKNWIEEKDQTLNLKKKFINICDLCAQIVYNKQCQEILIEHAHERQDDIVANKVIRDSTTYAEGFRYFSPELIEE